MSNRGAKPRKESAAMADAKTPQTGEPQGDAKPPEFTTFDEYLAAQPEPIKALVTDRFSSLEGALDKERSNAKDAAKQLRDLAKTTDGAVAEKLNKLAAEKDAEVDRARAELRFTREAIAAGCKPDLLADAWTIAQASGLTDVGRLKGAKPWLFAEPSKPDAKAGNGAGQPDRTPKQVDDVLRNAFFQRAV